MRKEGRNRYVNKHNTCLKESKKNNAQMEMAQEKVSENLMGFNWIIRGIMTLPYLDSQQQKREEYLSRQELHRNLYRLISEY